MTYGLGSGETYPRPIDAPLACDGCGRTWDRADMLEAYLPSRVITFDTITEPFSFTLLTLGWVGPCCAALANEWQP